MDIPGKHKDYRYSTPTINEIETSKPDNVDYSILYSMSLRSSLGSIPNDWDSVRETVSMAFLIDH